MKVLVTLTLLLGCIFCATAFPEPNPVYDPPNFLRVRRFVEGGQQIGGQNPQQAKPEWEVRPDLNRDGQGNVNGKVVVENHGRDHDLEAGWGQTIRGPNKHSETWHVGGSIRWP